MGFLDSLRDRFQGPERLPPGIHHYQSPAENPLNYRLHLRVEENGEGILLVNASTVLHLNQTAAEYAYHLIKQTPEDEVAAEMATRYRVKSSAAKQDFAELKDKIETLIATPDLDPVTYLDFERHRPYSDEVSAPYRLDCALTYQLPDKADAHAAPRKRVERELSTNEWKQIIDKAWAVGIPHILFTGGEPTMRDDLVELIEYAEKAGQVTGLLTDGLKLSDSGYLNSLLQAGLDHATIILHPDDGQTWEALASFKYWAEVLDEDIFVTAHLTLTRENANRAMALLDKLAEANVSAVSLSAHDHDLADALQDARSYADDLNLSLVWDLPVPYSSLNPVALEMEAAEDTSPADGAGVGWLYVEPDGDVLPSQGVNEVLGNLLRDEWAAIWKKSEAYRKK